MTVDEQIVFETAKVNGLSDQRAAIFVRFWRIRFEMRLDPAYMIEWINRFKKGFDELIGLADSQSLEAIARACWEVIE